MGLTAVRIRKMITHLQRIKEIHPRQIRKKTLQQLKQKHRLQMEKIPQEMLPVRKKMKLQQKQNQHILLTL